MPENSISSILNDESGVESLFASEVFGVIKDSEMAKAVIFDAIDEQLARIKESPIDQALSEVDAGMDIADYEQIADFLRGETAHVPFGYYGGSGFVWANAVDPNKVDNNHRIALTEENTPLNPVKQMTTGIVFTKRRSTVPGEDILKPKFTVTTRIDDVYRETPENRRRFYRPSVGIEIAVMPDDSIVVRPTKYSAEAIYRGDPSEFSSNHPLAKELEVKIRALAKGRK